MVNYNRWSVQQRIDMPMWYRTVVAARNGVYVSELNLPINETLHAILEDLRSQGFKALVVGGAVRDAVMGVVPKDIDIEVYGADYDALHTTLSKYGRADVVGKSFGVLKLRTPDGQDYDFSVPRRDSKTGDGHTGFEVKVDHTMTPKEAAARRDFTMNCFAKETLFITKDGVLPAEELCGHEHELLTAGGQWVSAPVVSFGIQKLMRVTLKRNRIRKVFYTTPQHRWFIRDKHTGKYNRERTTSSLRKGHRLPSVFPVRSTNDLSVEGVCRGFVFGDGNNVTWNSGTMVSVANFCGEKDMHLLSWFAEVGVGCPPHDVPYGKRISTLPPHWKFEFPALTEDASYLYGWLAGYFAADGCVDSKGCPTLSSSNRENLEYVESLCRYVGVGTFQISPPKIGSGYNSEAECYQLSFVRSTLGAEFFLIPHHRERFVQSGKRERTGWVVDSVEETDREEEVFCAIVPETHVFCLDGNILTSNCLAYDPLTSEVHDYYGGIEDLENGVLRATTEAFKEDPLRVLRGMQFAARYGMRLDPDTAKMCREIVDSHAEIATERRAEEWMKLAIKGKRPGTALEYLADTGWLKHYPELEALFGVPQDPEWHPEGWSHFDAPDHKRNLYTKEDQNVSHWQDVTGFTGNASNGSRMVSTPYKSSNPDRQHENSPEPHIYVTMDVPIDSYWRYVYEQDRIDAKPIADLAVRHLVSQYGGEELNGKTHYRMFGNLKASPAVYCHAEKQGNHVELTVGLHSELSKELIDRGCPTHVYVKMGDVATHTAHVMDAAAAIAERDGLVGDDRATLVFAAMVHDIAKPQTTEIQYRAGRGMSVTSIGHEKAGEPIAVDLLKRMGIKKSIRDKVGPMVARHLAHITTTPNKSNVRKLAHDIAPASIEELARLIEADHSGRPPLPQELPSQAQDMLDIARKDGVANGKPTPIVQGKHVLPYYGGASGRHIGTAVQDAYSAYINGAYDNFEGGQQWLSNYLQSRAAMLKGADVIALGVKPGPVIGQILNEAWQMQVAGVFTSRDDALAWLSRRVSSDATLVQ